MEAIKIRSNLGHCLSIDLFGEILATYNSYNIILSHMHPKFSRDGRVSGYLGQCPKFDRIFILIASLSYY